MTPDDVRMTARLVVDKRVHRPSHKPLEYFRSRTTVDPQTGCWLWGLGRNRCGYGEFRDGDGYIKKAHRGAWESVNGPVPARLCVCHRCDVRRCCNPDHLFLGTNAENTHDRDEKQRQVKGSKHWASVFDEPTVAIIKTLLGLGVGLPRLEALYGVSRSALAHIKHGRAWTHVEAVSP